MRNLSIIALTALVAVAAPASAAKIITSTSTFAIGSPNFYITSGSPTAPSITANFGNGFGTKLTFDDTYTFTIPQTGVGSGSLSTSFSSAMNKLTITDLIINGKSYEVPKNNSGQFTSVGDIAITPFALNTIEVKGTTSARGGTYSGTMTFSAASAGAVPEPASWAMMLGGFGMLGSVMRKRSKVSFA